MAHPKNISTTKNVQAFIFIPFRGLDLVMFNQNIAMAWAYDRARLMSTNQSRSYPYRRILYICK